MEMLNNSRKRRRMPAAVGTAGMLAVGAALAPAATQAAVVAAKFEITPAVWTVGQSTNTAQRFTSPGADTGDIVLKLNDVALPFGGNGVVLATTAQGGAGNDNFACPYATGGGTGTTVSTVDH